MMFWGALRARPARSLVLALALCGCSSPSDPRGEPDLYRGRYDPEAHRFVLEHRTTASVSAGIEMEPGPAWTDSALQVHVPVALRNVGPGLRFMPRGIQVDGFAPAGVWPVNAGCVPPLPGDLSPQCIFWYWETYGEDRSLAPGEASLSVEWIFTDPGDRPFEFTAWLWWPHG